MEESGIPKRLLCLDAFVINEAARNLDRRAALLDWLNANDVTALVHRLVACEVFDSNSRTDLDAREAFLNEIPSLLLVHRCGIDVIDVEIALWGMLGRAPNSAEVLEPMSDLTEIGASRQAILTNWRQCAPETLAADREWNHAKVFHRAVQVADPPKVSRTIGELLDADGTTSTSSEIVERIARTQTPLGKGLHEVDRSVAMESFRQFVADTTYTDAKRYLCDMANNAFVALPWFRDLTWGQFERFRRLWTRLPHSFGCIDRSLGIDYRAYCCSLNTVDPSLFRSLDVFWSLSDKYHADPRRKQDASSTRDFWHIAFSPHVPVLVADREMAGVFDQCRRKLVRPGRVISGRGLWQAVFRSLEWDRLVVSSHGRG
jgi:hypothetical protein